MSEEKKIIIDEDWKSQVEAEKEAAAQQTTGQPSTSVGGSDDSAEPDGKTEAAGASDPSGSPGADADPPMPPASIAMLISSLATEALLAMGQMPHPATGETLVRRNQAKYLIDTLDVLKEKTEGNLTPDEAAALDDVLHQLRMVFVAAG